MYKIGLVGAESFHSEKFAKLINELKVIDARVTHIWGEKGQEERAEHIKNTYNIETKCTDLTEMIGNVDVAFLVTRNGANHFAQAKPFMDAKIPLWIDKPVALDSADVEKICDYALSHDAMLTGGSTLKHSVDITSLKDELNKFEKIDYFSISYCSSLGNVNGGASFYSIHLAELANYFLGDDIENMCANVCGQTLVITLNYKNGTVANLIMTEGGYNVTYSAVHGTDCIAKAVGCHDCYEEGLRYVIDVVEGKREPLSKDDFVIPVKIMEAMETAINNPGTYVSYVK